MEDTAVEFSKEQLGRMVHILGMGSASYRALEEMKRREKAGEYVCCYWTGDTFLVGPPLPPGKE